ncbi:hypothetical protein [Paucisalibacillus sp. EB02]|uniref:hypothetical protein n=1 Tax=Paucisalibacillus sp. EB02 TaxID=1347087 RepID=UPI0012DD8A44|nr:hypothetical protein [Paucisalibacillus sp. EB02]
MVEVRYKRGLVNMMDIYGSTKIAHGENVDILIASKVLFPNDEPEEILSHKRFIHSYGKTLVIDLEQTEEEIFRSIHKNARYKINRASKRDPLHYQELKHPTDEEINDFIQFFDRFAKHKKLPKGNKERLQHLRDQDALIISYMTDKEDNVLCYHAYVKTESYCSMLFSASARFENSTIRNMIGRANRYLHWQDMKSFRNMGQKWFDFGGLFVESLEDDEEHINRFKKEFGGKTVDVDKRIYPLTLIGRITALVFWVKMRKRPEFLRARSLKGKRYISKNA